jgi:asparagine synthase (glutamine-hydrolysing)
MSRELIVLAGSSNHDSAARCRRRIVDNAAGQMPGYLSHESIASDFAVVALVVTGPEEGSVALLDREPDNVLASVALTSEGIDVARKGDSSHTVAAEAAHVVVRVRTDGSVELETDGIATIPAYWHAGHEHFCASTHLATLPSLGVDPELDDVAIVEYLVMLHPLDQRTLLRDVRITPPGGRVTWRPGSAAFVEHHPIFVPSHAMAADDATAIVSMSRVWADVLEELWRRHKSSPIWVGLSGGLDSRSVAAGLKQLGHRPATFSYGDRHVRDTRIAALVADRLRLPYLRLPVDEDALMPSPLEIVDKLDGAHSPAEMFDVWFSPRIRGLTNTVVNGAGGGPLWGDEKTIGATDARQVLEAVMFRYEPALAGVLPFLTDDGAARARHLLREGLRESLGHWDFAAREDMSVFWRIANRQVRWGNMLVGAMRRSGIRSELPFLDSRFLEFAASLAPDQRRNGALHLKVQRSVFRETADIPRSDDGNPPAHLNHVYWSADRSYGRQVIDLASRHPVSGARRVARRALATAVHAARDRSMLTTLADRWDNTVDTFPLDIWARANPLFAERVASMAESDSASDTLVSAQRLERGMRDALAASFSGSVTALARAASVQRWARDYRLRSQAAMHIATTA